jgi:ATP phosphoribosyltransferase
MKKDQKKILKVGLPKGSLQEATFKILRKAGFNVSVSERSYLPSIDDEELDCVLLRAQEMSRYVEAGVLDCGITGNDWVLENDSSVIHVADLVYAKQSMSPVRWVLAVPESSKIHSPNDLRGKLIATELVNVTKKYLKKHNVTAEVEFSWGATEVKVASGLVDAIVELTETGRSLKAHKLREVETICTSTTQLIANKDSYKDAWKQKKIAQMVLLLKGAITSEGKVGLKMNVPQKKLETILKVLPALRNPTISHLSTGGWVAVETIIDERTVKQILPLLKEHGAEGIIEYPLNKVIY